MNTQKTTTELEDSDIEPKGEETWVCCGGIHIYKGDRCPICGDEE